MKVKEIIKKYSQNLIKNGTYNVRYCKSRRSISSKALSYILALTNGTTPPKIEFYKHKNIYEIATKESFRNVEAILSMFGSLGDSLVYAKDFGTKYFAPLKFNFKELPNEKVQCIDNKSIYEIHNIANSTTSSPDGKLIKKYYGKNFISNLLEMDVPVTVLPSVSEKTKVNNFIRDNKLSYRESFNAEFCHSSTMKTIKRQTRLLSTKELLPFPFDDADYKDILFTTELVGMYLYNGNANSFYDLARKVMTEATDAEIKEACKNLTKAANLSFLAITKDGGISPSKFRVFAALTGTIGNIEDVPTETLYELLSAIPCKGRPSLKKEVEIARTIAKKLMPFEI